eukprot:1377999-Amorphochlora_amoeboformis.AAC.2
MITRTFALLDPEELLDAASNLLEAAGGLAGEAREIMREIATHPRSFNFLRKIFLRKGDISRVGTPK